MNGALFFKQWRTSMKPLPLAKTFAVASSLAATALATTFSIAPDGNFLIDGKPRYLLGTIIYHQPTTNDFRRTGGYSLEDAWIYETPPDRAYLERLGFDSVGGEVSQTWQEEFRPERIFWQAHKALDWDLATNWWNSGLPTIVDFTCARWSHGSMRAIEVRPPSSTAIPEKDCGHFMPYSLVTDEGRALYARMWRAGAKELKEHGAAPYAYELFNEPTYDELTPASRAAFARDLAEIFKGDAAAMDAAWGSSYGSFDAAAGFRHPNECAGLGVEWLKFRERVFKSGIVLGAETIREVVPDARVCFQPVGASFGHVNMLEANRPCGVVMSQTGGGGAFEALLLRAIADGKPIIDGETYFGHTRASHRAKVLLQYARGFNASYYFKWDRRLNDPDFAGPGGDERKAERFPYMALNPAATPASAFAGMLDAKSGIAAVHDIFAPRERGIGREERAAFLVSLPTERLGVAAGHGNHNFTKSAAEALVAAHIPAAAIFEEQLAERRLDDYRFLVAAGIDATYPATVGLLREWVSGGGTLVLEQEAMTLDEWSRPRAADATWGLVLGEPATGDAVPFAFAGDRYTAAPYRATVKADGWETVAALPDGTPAILELRIGKGRVIFVAARLAAGEEARLLAHLAIKAGISPNCRATDFETGEEVADLEVHAARRRAESAFILILHGLAPRAVRFIPGNGFDAKTLVNVGDGAILERDGAGAALLLMEPEMPVVLRGGNGAGNAPLPAGAALHPVPYSEVAAAAPGWLAARRPKPAGKFFSADPARSRFVDLRAAANRGFNDSVAGDGEGGWTDQGENCLRNVPWGPTDCNGVTFDFIRPDQNDGRSCVMLRSSSLPQLELPEAVCGIGVGQRAEALYFLHAGAWMSGVNGEVFRYVVHYADGSSEAVPILAGRDIGDWWFDVRKKPAATARCRPGWKNSESRGFHVLRWDNPHPEKTIAVIDIVGSSGPAVPIVAAITAELPDESPLAAWRMAAKAHGGAKAILADGGLSLAADDATKDWAGVRLALPAPLPLDGGGGEAEFAFEINGGRTGLGTYDTPPPPFQVAMTFVAADGTERRGKYITPEIEGGGADGDPATWQTVRIPLRRLLGEDAAALAAIHVQFKLLPARRANLVMRRFRIEEQPGHQ